MFSSFDGSHTRKRDISLGGRSRAGHQNATASARAARAERATKRREEAAANTFQRIWRGRRVRQSVHDGLRKRWDSIENFESNAVIERVILATHFFIANCASDLLRLNITASMVTKLLCIQKVQTSAQSEDVNTASISSFQMKKFSRILLKAPLNTETSNFFLKATEEGIWQSQEQYEDFVGCICSHGIFEKFLQAHTTLDGEAATKLMSARLLSSNIASVYAGFAREILVKDIESLPPAEILTLAFVEKLLAYLSPISTSATPRSGLTAAAPSTTSDGKTTWSLDDVKSHGDDGVWLLVNLVKICSPYLFTSFATTTLLNFVALSCELLKVVPMRFFRPYKTLSLDDSDDDEDDDEQDGKDATLASGDAQLFAQWQPLTLFTTASFLHRCMALYQSGTPEGIQLLCTVANVAVDRCRTPLQRATLLSVIAFERGVVASIWRLLMTSKKRDEIVRFENGTLDDYDGIVSYLRLHADAYSHLLMTQDDDEFFGRGAGGIVLLGQGSGAASVQLSLREKAEMVVVLKDLAVSLFMGSALYFYTKAVTDLRGALCKLLKQLHVRDERERFCDDSAWMSSTTTSSVATGALSRITVEEFRHSQLEASFRHGGTQSAGDMGVLLVLKHLSFVVPFDARARIFQRLIADDSAARVRQTIDPAFGLSRGGNVFVTIRREHMYQDAFDQLSALGPSLRSRVRVQMTNEHGLNEAGIDGGGLFREFLTDIIKQGFGPDAGLFRATPERQIYPHPVAHIHHADSLAHFEFLGRLLGKALYSGMLMELPFAPFFLSKLLGDVPFLNDLKSLDPEVHKNLLFLKHYEGDCADLSLDFSISEDTEIGSVDGNVVDLIPGGRDVPVTNENKIRYVYHVANYRLNIQIRRQCNAFLKGLFDLVDREWFTMFSAHELQTLISGKETTIDITDLRNNTNYSGEFTQAHPTIAMFWIVMEEMSHEDRHAVVKV